MLSSSRTIDNRKPNQGKKKFRDPKSTADERQFYKDAQESTSLQLRHMPGEKPDQGPLTPGFCGYASA